MKVRSRWVGLVGILMCIGGTWTAGQSVAGLARGGPAVQKQASPSRTFSDQDLANTRGKGAITSSSVPTSVERQSRPEGSSTPRARSRTTYSSPAGQQAPSPRQTASVRSRAGKASSSVSAGSPAPGQINLTPGQESTVNAQAKRYTQETSGYYTTKEVARRAEITRQQEMRSKGIGGNSG